MVLWLSTHIQKISITAQFNLVTFRIQYWELLLTCPCPSDPSDHTHMNRLNQIQIYLRMQKINFTSQLIFEIELTHCFESLWACLTTSI